MKPMLATDADESKLRFPLIVQPKVDGVRALNLFGRLTGRSLKEHANKHVTARFSHSKYIGLDGEMAVDSVPYTHEALCRLTTSALNTISGTPSVDWWVFDLITAKTKDLPYAERRQLLELKVRELADPHVRMMPGWLIHSKEQLDAADEWFIEQGFEGTITRDPGKDYKYGRSTVREQGLLRIKRFVEEEAVVIAITEGQHNANEAKTNELGQTERSTHQENMVPNGMVGNLICKALKDVVDHNGNTLIACGQEITVAAGRMPHGDREFYFANPGLIIGMTIKFKFFPKGIKDKPRFPTFQSLRMDSDR